jgi:hypothetical protein
MRDNLSIFLAKSTVNAEGLEYRCKTSFNIDKYNNRIVNDKQQFVQ